MHVTAIERNIQDIEAIGAMTGVDIANIVDVSKATVSRWRTGTKRPCLESPKILSDLAYAVRRLEEYYSSDEIRLWLYSPHPQLDGKRAVDFIHDGQLVDVLQVLDRLDADGHL